MLTLEEFQDKYHSFRTADGAAAAREALAAAVANEQIVVVRFQTEYCLMTLTAVGLLIAMDLGRGEFMEVYDPRRLLAQGAGVPAPGKDPSHGHTE